MPEVTALRSFSWNWWPCLVTVSEQAATRTTIATAAPTAHLPCQADLGRHPAGVSSIDLPMSSGERIIQTSLSIAAAPGRSARPRSPPISNPEVPTPDPSHQSSRPICQDALMLTRLRLWRDRHEKARSLYGSIVTQARSRGFYAHWGVPDTADGRFEMIVLHLAMVLHRLGREGQAGQRLAQALTEAFAVDLDDNLREMTVGDLAVPRHVKRAVGALHERHVSYGAALAASDDGPLTAALHARLEAVGAG